MTTQPRHRPTADALGLGLLLAPLALLVGIAFTTLGASGTAVPDGTAPTAGPPSSAEVLASLGDTQAN